MRILLILALAACDSSKTNVTSDADAKQAYLGLDASIDKAITLGFAGFNASTSANIPPQTAAGAVSGTLTVTGQVDHGASTNKTMRLQATYTSYNDDKLTTYDSGGASDMLAVPLLSMNLKNVPTGTLDGTFDGVVVMTGKEKGDLTFALSFTGELQAGTGMSVERKPGTTHITGTALSAAGTYNVDVTR